MAYVDLFSTGVTPVAVAAGQQTTYNWAYDTPVASDGSPHLTMLGVQFDMTMAANPTLVTTAGRLISNLRIKVGANEIINFNDPFVDADGVVPGNLSVLCQKAGGVDTAVEYGTNQILAEMSLPFGLDATRSHRVNITMTLNSETDWCGVALTPATTEFNMIHYFGTSKEATLYGSRQDFDLTDGSIRNITVFGKAG
jgi:hypothetical protein